jgi:1-acyl-sn-glycerol-3-phosphate acyltransferase
VAVLGCSDTKALVCWVMRLLFLFGGFNWVTVRGKQASAKDAPVLVVAPHSTYFDALPVVLMGGPSVVAKGETGHLPFFGSRISLCNFRLRELNVQNLSAYWAPMVQRQI